MINGVDSFPLMAVPFFILAGEVMNTGGLARRIINFAIALVGHLRGGLGYVAILASCIWRHCRDQRLRTRPLLARFWSR